LFGVYAISLSAWATPAIKRSDASKYLIFIIAPMMVV